MTSAQVAGARRDVATLVEFYASKCRLLAAVVDGAVRVDGRLGDVVVSESVSGAARLTRALERWRTNRSKTTHALRVLAVSTPSGTTARVRAAPLRRRPASGTPPRFFSTLRRPVISVSVGAIQRDQLILSARVLRDRDTTIARHTSK